MLCRELKSREYQGSERAVYRYLTYLHTQFSHEESSQAMQPALSSKRVTWLLVKLPSDLDEQAQQELVTLRQSSLTADMAYPLIQAFRQMVHERQGDQLNQWVRIIEWEFNLR